jgi:hypothetical protein
MKLICWRQRNFGPCAGRRSAAEATGRYRPSPAARRSPENQNVVAASLLGNCPRREDRHAPIKPLARRTFVREVSRGHRVIPRTEKTTLRGATAFSGAPVMRVQDGSSERYTSAGAQSGASAGNSLIGMCTAPNVSKPIVPNCLEVNLFTPPCFTARRGLTAPCRQDAATASAPAARRHPLTPKARRGSRNTHPHKALVV